MNITDTHPCGALRAGCSWRAPWGRQRLFRLVAWSHLDEGRRGVSGSVG